MTGWIVTWLVWFEWMWLDVGLASEKKLKEALEAAEMASEMDDEEELEEETVNVDEVVKTDEEL